MIEKFIGNKAKESSLFNYNDKSRILAISETIVTAFYTTIFIHCGKGDAIDIGANVGVHTRHLAFLTNPHNGRVLSVEPNEKLHMKITSLLEAEKLNNYLLSDKPVWDRETEMSFFYDVEDPQLSRLNESQGTKRLTTTLDSLVSEFNLNPTFIKIDAEGVDLEILLSSSNLIELFRPAFSVECGPWDSEFSLKNAFNFMRKFGYLMIDGSGREFSIENWTRQNHNQYWNRFLAPEEMKGAIKDFRKIVKVWSDLI